MQITRSRHATEDGLAILLIVQLGPADIAILDSQGYGYLAALEPTRHQSNVSLLTALMLAAQILEDNAKSQDNREN